MNTDQKKEITKISQEFARGLGIGINGSGWLVVDPLSAYLNSCGFENELQQIPDNESHPQVLIMTFKDGSKFIPAGGDMGVINKGFKNWQWL